VKVLWEVKAPHWESFESENYKLDFAFIQPLRHIFLSSMDMIVILWDWPDIIVTGIGFKKKGKREKKVFIILLDSKMRLWTWNWGKFHLYHVSRFYKIQSAILSWKSFSLSLSHCSFNHTIQRLHLSLCYTRPFANWTNGECD
jgi:hypothetical protein